MERTANLDGAPQTGQTVYTKTTTPSCEAYPNDSDLNAGMSISVGYWDFVEIRAIELEDPSGDVLAIPGITYNTIDPYP